MATAPTPQERGQQQQDKSTDDAPPPAKRPKTQVAYSSLLKDDDQIGRLVQAAFEEIGKPKHANIDAYTQLLTDELYDTVGNLKAGEKTRQQWVAFAKELGMADGFIEMVGDLLYPAAPATGYAMPLLSDDWDTAYITVSGAKSAGLSSQDGPSLLFKRPAVAELSNQLDMVHPLLYVQGPPGAGKSMATWAWAVRISVTTTVTWLHINRNLADSGRLHNKTLCIGPRTATLAEIRPWYSQHPSAILILDGVKNENSEWLDWAEGIAKTSGTRVRLVSSMQVRLREDQGIQPRVHDFPSWQWNEYVNACAEPRFCEQVAAALPASGAADEQTDTADQPPKPRARTTRQRRLEEQAQKEENDKRRADDATCFLRRLADKFILAGASCRWMFELSDETVKEACERYVASVSNPPDAIIGGTVGSRAPFAVNHLVARVDKQVFIVSLYVARLLITTHSQAVIKVAACLASTMNNPAFDGWVAEFDFVSQLRASLRTGGTLPVWREREDAGQEVRVSLNWAVKKEIITFKDVGELRKHAKAPFVDQWFLPERWNQACYDAAWLTTDGTLVVVQVTRAQSHSYKLKYVQELACAIDEANMDGLKIKHVNVMVVVPQGCVAPYPTVVFAKALDFWNGTEPEWPEVVYFRRTAGPPMFS